MAVSLNDVRLDQLIRRIKEPPRRIRVRAVDGLAAGKLKDWFGAKWLCTLANALLGEPPRLKQGVRKQSSDVQETACTCGPASVAGLSAGKFSVTV